MVKNETVAYMKSILTRAGTGTGSFFCFLALLGIGAYVADHWASPYSYILIGALSVWFLWKFAVQPFRAGLKKENGDGDASH